MLIDALCSWPAIIVGMAFFCLFVSICMYIWSLIADLEIIIFCSNKNIQQNRPIKLQCKRFIQLHLDCHRWTWAFNDFCILNKTLTFVTHRRNSTTFSVRIIATLEKIMSIPVTFQLPTYGVEFAIVLFHLENVSIHFGIFWNCWKFEKNHVFSINSSFLSKLNQKNHSHYRTSMISYHSHRLPPKWNTIFYSIS